MRFVLTLSALLGTTISSFAGAEADLLVAFDNSYTDGVGGDENAKVLTANSVAASNWINEQSGSPGRMRVCGYHQTWSQGGRSTLGGYIGWMGNYGDGYLDDVTAAADAMGADLVAFICEPVAGETSAAVAQQPGRYAAYGPANFWNNVVAHESGGHNYGLDHRAGRENPKTIMLHNYCGGGSQPWFSNPNIRLNGARLLGEGSCLGAAVQGGDAAYHLSTSAQAVADRYERVVWGSNLYPVVHRWQFHQAAGAAPAGTTVASSVGGSLATVRGQGATFTGSGLRLPGGTTGNTAANSIAAYIDLPNGLFSSMPSFTVEIRAAPLSAKNWMRIIEFGRTTQTGDGLGAPGEITGTPGSPAPGGTDASDVIGLSACTWTGSLNDQRFLAGVNGNIPSADSNLGTTAGEMHHYAITFADTTAGATVKWFRDGVLIKTLDVPFDSAALEDVNIWLGRSMWSGDEMAHIDYHDVRIIGAALADGQIAGNYRIGPHDAVSTMWASDGYGNSGFINGAWEFGGTPVATRDYEIGTLMLRSPFNGNSSFPGRSLTLTGGKFHLNGTAAKTTTVNDLRFKGGEIGSFAEGGPTQTLAGNIKLSTWDVGHIRGGWGPMLVSANISTVPGSGHGILLFTENPVTLTGNNTGYTGAMWVGDGRFSTLRISSETNLGSNPPWYGGDWLALNRGILETTATMTIDAPNRGVRIGPSGGFIRPAAGTTLTIATPMTSPASGNTVQTAPLWPNPVAGIFFKDGAGTLVLTNPNNSYIGEMQVLDGELRLDGAGRFNNGDHHMPTTVNSTLNLNTTANQTMGGVVSGTGTILKNNTGTLTLWGANTFSGPLNVNGGTVVCAGGGTESGRLGRGTVTFNSGTILRSDAADAFGYFAGAPSVINLNGATITTGGSGDFRTSLPNLSLTGAAITSLPGNNGDASGVWSFNAGSTISTNASATTSTIGSPKVGVQGALTINTAFGTATTSDLTISAALSNVSYGGDPGSITKTGAGRLRLTGASTYTGPTLVNAGTLTVTGSLANTATTIASGSTLGGTGSIAGATTINGTHTPGLTAGTQNFGSTLSYGSGSRLIWELTSNSTTVGASDRVAATGAVTIASGAKIDIIFNASGSGVALNESFWTQSRSWTFLTGSSVTGNFSIGTVSTDPASRSISNYGTLSLQQNTTSASLVFTPYTPSESWQLANFGSTANTGTAADTSDPDKDGLNNLLEYALGSNPNSNAASAAPQVSSATGRLKIAFTRNTAAADLTISVIAADSLTGPWAEIARSTHGAAFTVIAPGALISETGNGIVKKVEGTDIVLISDPAHPKRYMRLEIKR